MVVITDQYSVDLVGGRKILVELQFHQFVSVFLNFSVSVCFISTSLIYTFICLAVLVNLSNIYLFVLIIQAANRILKSTRRESNTQLALLPTLLRQANWGCISFTLKK